MALGEEAGLQAKPLFGLVVRVAVRLISAPKHTGVTTKPSVPQDGSLANSDDVSYLLCGSKLAGVFALLLHLSVLGVEGQ